VPPISASRSSGKSLKSGIAVFTFCCCVIIGISGLYVAEGETAFVAGFRSAADGRGLRGNHASAARRMHFATPERCVAELVDLATFKDSRGRMRTDCRAFAALARPNRNIEPWRLSCDSRDSAPRGRRERRRMAREPGPAGQLPRGLLAHRAVRACCLTSAIGHGLNGGNREVNNERWASWQ